jgi:hypothetical protein
MGVAIGQSGDGGRPLEVDDLGAGAGELAQLGVEPDGDDRPVGDGDCARRRAVGIERAHACADDEQVGCAHVIPPLAATARRAGFQPGPGTEARSSFV